MIITGDDPEYIAFVKARLSEQFLMSDLGPLRYFLGIEVSSTLTVSLYPKNGIFMIFLLVPLLLMSVLLRLPWTSISLFVLSVVIPSLIRLVIDILSGVSSI